MTVDLRIEHDGGGTSTLTGQVGAEWTRDLDEQARAEVTLYRDDWAGVEGTVDERNDEFYVVVDGGDEFGGRFDDIQSRDATVSLRLNGPEIDMADAEPTGNNLIYQNVSDDTIITDAITSVGTVSAGVVSTLAPSIGYSASYASQSKVLRDMREATGGEILYDGTTDPWTVDYVNEVGADKSGSVTLGPANQNIGDDFEKTVDEREEVTHVRGLGAQQGPDQVTATAVASSYSGGKEVWRRYENKEVVDQSRLQDIIDTLVDEYDGEPRAVDVTCTVYDEALRLGDTVTVDYSEEGISRTLRVVGLTTSVSTGGRTQQVTLSNRTLTRRHRDAKARDDLQRFNRGYQGFVDRDQVTSGWNVAGDGIAQELEIPSWPDDIVTEQQVDLTVQGRAWRSPIDISGHTHDVDVTHPNHSHSVSGTTDANNQAGTQFANSRGGGTSVGTSWTTLDSLSVSSPNDTQWGFMNSIVQNNESSTVTLSIRYNNNSTGLTAGGASVPMDPNEVRGFAMLDPNNVSGTTMQLQAQVNSGTASIQHSSEFVGGGRHAHGVSETSSAELGTTETATSTSNSAGSASVIDTFGGTTYYPTDVEVRVNGSLITTIAGNNSASWQSTVDLRSELVAGANTITALPTTQRGSLNLHLTNELFRRGPQSN